MTDTALIGRLRRYFLALAPWLAKRKGWTEEDLTDMGASIKHAIDTDNAELLACWERDLFGKMQELKADDEFERMQFAAALERDREEDAARIRARGVVK